MTDNSGVEGLEHALAVGGLIFTGVVGLLAWASGSKEGRAIASERGEQERASSVATAAGGAVYAGMIDNEAYRAVIAGLEDIKQRLDRLVTMDQKLARLVEFGENQDEREERERQHADLRDTLRGLMDELRADMMRGDERRSTSRKLPPP